MRRLTRLINGLNESVGRVVAWCTLFMVLLTCAIVVMRYVFDVGSIALQESVTYLHALVFMLGAAYTLKHGAHVRVDVFYHRFSPRRQAIIDLAGTLIFLFPVTVFLFVTSLDYVAEAWRVQESSREPGGLPWVYLLKTVIPVAATLLVLQGVALLLDCVMKLRGDR